MVAIRNTHVKGKLDLEAWWNSLNVTPEERTKIQKVFEYCHNKIQETDDNMLRLTNRAIEIIGILQTLHMDIDSYLAAILYPHIEEHYFTIEQAEIDFGKQVAKLLRGVKDMEAIRFLQNMASSTSDISNAKIDTVRRMLLAMVEDVRAVIIKLSERIATLREVKNADEETRVAVAKEISNIYAPLANRLGIGQLKWELEDLSFRYLHPDTYKQIAKLLDEKRVDREKYIVDFVAILEEKLKSEGLDAEVYGRPKHIYSIWRKMQKKHLNFTELYDVRAVRVIVKRLQDCYSALGVIHTCFHHIPKEFDDYIANPKPNGYKSIHTVVIGPQGKTVEIQIRTADMHKDAELGVAAHWKYKEGGSNLDAAYEERIAWLRKLLKWQEDMVEAGSIVEEFKTQVFEDRVYVFTPKGDVIDLPQGATPLDFAYQIHSMIGHRCIGAKVDGRIVPFTYQLQTGEQVELATQKEPNPSRDWLNPNNGFLRTSKARAKVSAWFKQLDREKNIAAGREMLEREIERHGLTITKEKLPDLIKDVLHHYNVRDHYDVLANVGSGDIRINQLMNYIEAKVNDYAVSSNPDDEILRNIEMHTQNKMAKVERNQSNSRIVVNGVGNLVTHVAKCCHPIPGEDIVGFITKGRGVSVHRKGCHTINHLSAEHPERLVEAVWGGDYSSGFSVTVGIIANDRAGLLRDITTIIANEKINVLGVRSRSDTKTQTAQMDIDMEVFNINDLNRTLARLNNMPGILSAKRL
ncbi:MAG: GTP diphosphokinase [Ruminobacter sp.]|jgi:GTP pyrophosphokinase|nr:GTP diphosphokinase [Ruminobacter sp.]